MKLSDLNRVVIQLVECYIWDVVVAGSNPVYPTNIGQWTNGKVALQGKGKIE